jgi:hypothetical protein
MLQILHSMKFDLDFMEGEKGLDHSEIFQNRLSFKKIFEIWGH